jgi:hypothetical protein
MMHSPDPKDGPPLSASASPAAQQWEHWALQAYNRAHDAHTRSNDARGCIVMLDHHDTLRFYYVTDFS